MVMRERKMRVGTCRGNLFTATRNGFVAGPDEYCRTILRLGFFAFKSYWVLRNYAVWRSITGTRMKRCSGGRNNECLRMNPGNPYIFS